ncbi:hypothetical protein ACWDA7_37025, partial [Streptomyces sp. NPDC001156]
VGRVRVVRGGKRLARNRHHLHAAQLTQAQWRQRWEVSRWYLQADKESSKRFGNETIRVTPEGEISLKLPAPLAHLADAPHGRYTLTSTAVFHHRSDEWADRITTNRSVAYRIHYVSMAAELGITIIAVDPAHTSRWGAQHWQKPPTRKNRKTTRHDAASIAIGRRALGHRIRRRTAPPPHGQSDHVGHRTAQAGHGTPGREETRPRILGPRTRSVSPDAARTRETSAFTTVRDAPVDQDWVQDSLLLTD